MGHRFPLWFAELEEARAVPLRPTSFALRSKADVRLRPAGSAAGGRPLVLQGWEETPPPPPPDSELSGSG